MEIVEEAAENIFLNIKQFFGGGTGREAANICYLFYLIFSC